MLVDNVFISKTCTVNKTFIYSIHEVSMQIDKGYSMT